MTVLDLYRFLENRLPRQLSAEWDNDGLCCCPDEKREVRRVLVALDVTEQTVDAAIDGGFDVVLSHHPLLFRGVKELTPFSGTVSRKLLRLARAGVAAMSFHTRLDAAEGGVNDILAALLGLENVRAFGPEGEVPCGRVGELKAPMAACEVAALVKKSLGTECVLLAGTGEVRTVAVLGGEGGDYIDAAAAAGADLFVSGRLGYHRMLDAAEEGPCLVEAGHYATEFPVCAHLAALLKEADATLQVEIVPSAVIQILS